MLKGISKIVSPELLKVLAEMGHSDCIVFADANFPVESCGKNSKIIRCDGHGIPDLLGGVLPLFPLDAYCDTPVTLMQVMPGDLTKTPIWKSYEDMIAQVDERGKTAITTIDRFEFYKEAAKAYAIVATGETALYASVLLQKGVLVGME